MHGLRGCLGSGGRAHPRVQVGHVSCSTCPFRPFAVDEIPCSGLASRRLVSVVLMLSTYQVFGCVVYSLAFGRYMIGQVEVASSQTRRGRALLSLLLETNKGTQ